MALEIATNRLAEGEFAHLCLFAHDNYPRRQTSLSRVHNTKPLSISRRWVCISTSFQLTVIQIGTVDKTAIVNVCNNFSTSHSIDDVNWHWKTVANRCQLMTAAQRMRCNSIN